MPETQPATGTDSDPVDDSTTEPATPTVEELRAELEKARANSRKWEDRAKANKGAAAELDALKAQSMTETEQAVAKARQEAAQEASRAFGARLVDAEVKAAAAGRPVDIDALLDGLDRSKFLDDDGEPNTDAIRAWVDRIAPEQVDPDPLSQVIDLGQGQRTPTPALNSTQLERDLKAKLGIR